MTRNQEQTRVAVIGTGLAGLTTAYLLRQDEGKRHHVTLFESSKKLSFDSESVTVRNEVEGHSERIDLPMRAVAGGFYANLMRMYRHLNIPLHPIQFIFAFADANTLPRTRHDSHGDVGKVNHFPEAYYRHASNFHQLPLLGLSALSQLPRLLLLLACYCWFTVACFIVRPGDEESVAEYLGRIRLPQRFFVSRFLLPLMSSVSTCTHEQLLAFPAADIVKYKTSSLFQHHYVVCGGVNTVQARLWDAVDGDVRLGHRVVQAVPEAGGVRVRWQTNDEDHVSEEVFDRAILAVSPNVAASIFAPLCKTLRKIPTTQVESSILVNPKAFSIARENNGTAHCMHHDRRSPPAPQTIMFNTDFSDKVPRTEALHQMPGGVVVSTCPLEEMSKDNVLLTARFTRTLRTPQSRALVKGIFERLPSSPANQWVNGGDNVWVVGAWCWDGLVLLEGCVVSAMNVARDLGVEIPWEA